MVTMDGGQRGKRGSDMKKKMGKGVTFTREELVQLESVLRELL